MELTPYLEALQRDLTNAAAVGGEDVARAAGLLGGAIEASGRLVLLEALSDAAAEITGKLPAGVVEVRLRGREAQFVVTELEPTTTTSSVPPSDVEGDITRITLRIPEQLKDAAEAAAASAGLSVNAWLVRAVAAAVSGGPSSGSRRPSGGRRYTGYAQA